MLILVSLTSVALLPKGCPPSPGAGVAAPGSLPTRQRTAPHRAFTVDRLPRPDVRRLVLGPQRRPREECHRPPRPARLHDAAIPRHDTARIRARLRERRRVAIERRDVLPLVVCAACGYGVYQYLWIIGLANTTAFASSLLGATAPIFTLAFVAIAGHESFAAGAGSAPASRCSASPSSKARSPGTQRFASATR